MKKKISVLMTVYNTEKYLKQSINSILNQSYKNFELVIVDDCSSDGSRKLIKDLKNKRVKKYFLKRHTGRTPALNFGLSKCKGKYIAVMDADDIAHKNRLLKQKKFLEKDDNRQIVGSNIVFINEYGKKIKDFYIPKSNKELNTKIIFHNYLPHSSAMYKKNFLKRIGDVYPKDYKYGQDYALWLKFALKTKIYVLPDILIKQRVLPNSMSKTNNLRLTRNVELLKHLIFSLKHFKLNYLKKVYILFLILKGILKLFLSSVKVKI